MSKIRRMSEPHNFNSSLPLMKTNINKTRAKVFSDNVLIKAFPESSKVMLVQFVASDKELNIKFTQLINSKMQYFSLCNLDYSNLVVGWFWNNPNMFVIAASHNNKLYHEIYCYPRDIQRNEWLKFFEKNNIYSLPFFENFKQNYNTKYIINSVKEIISSSSTTDSFNLEFNIKEQNSTNITN
jgi:hypothetical protein